MATVRTLCIAGGGGGGDDTGAGAGGMLDQSLDIKRFKEYEVQVGAKGNAGGANQGGSNGEDSHIKDVDVEIYTEEFSLEIPFDSSNSKSIDVSGFSDADQIILEFDGIGGGGDGGNFDRLRNFSIDGVDILTSGGVNHSNDHFETDVSHIFNNQDNVTILGDSRDESGTVNLTFKTGWVVKTIGGGAGGGEEDNGKYGGSGGGGDGVGPGDTRGFPGGGAGNQGNRGSGGDEASSSTGGGGNGAGGGAGGPSPGFGGDDEDGADGGPGLASDITGTSVTYAAGGGGRNAGSTDGADGAGHGNPGSGGRFSQDGYDGIVVFRYDPDDFPHKWKGGTITEDGGDKIHTFTADGKFEPVLSAQGFMRF